ncbi:hypothetical protein HMPREF9166_1857 [Selenomonas sp. oral taxon 149 str. 67H29BP]|nr:hypothetical protein HMPREF9166_1857 [Selenomonas sp. oral taxon 149 str. 67H29BP]
MTHLFACTSAENPPQSPSLRPVFRLVRTKNLRQSEGLHFISGSFIISLQKNFSIFSF